MQYRVLDKMENKFIDSNNVSLSPEGKVFNGNIDISNRVDIQDFLNIYDRNSKPVFIGDALTVKKEWFLDRSEIYFPEMQSIFIGSYDFDELLIQISKNSNDDMFFYIYFKRNAVFLTNKDMGFLDSDEDEIRMLPMDDRGTLRFLSRSNAIEVVYDVTDKEKWIIS